MGFYDNEIKRLCTKSPRLLTMAINHIFKKNHCLDTPVIFLDREQNVDEHPTFMDMLVQIEDCKYHIEYQLLEGNMAIRMYVYAVKETIVELESVTEYSDKYEVNVTMPQQTVIFLSGANRKNEIKVNLTLPDNKVVSYMLPCISASETIAQLSEKKLYLLFPFQQVQLNSKMNKLAGKKTEYKL